MQPLYPTTPSRLSNADLAELYAYPAEGSWVRANFVATIDGAVQGPDLRSGSLSPGADQRLFALLRSLCDLVLVGAGTTRAEGYRPVQADEVDGDLRAALGLAPVPTIAVVSRSLALTDDLLRGGAAPTIVITCASAPQPAVVGARRHCQVIVAGDEQVDLGAALERLNAMGFRRVLCEGGPHLMHELVASGLCDELCLTLVPLVESGDRLRLAAGPVLNPPTRMTLWQVLEDEGALYLDYRRMPG